MAIDDIHPSWPKDPPKVIDNIPPEKPKKQSVFEQCVSTIKASVLSVSKMIKKIITKARYWLFHKKWQASTKYCPRCGNTSLGEMATLNLKVCQNCVPNVWLSWKLEKNQKPRI